MLSKHVWTSLEGRTNKRGISTCR